MSLTVGGTSGADGIFLRRRTIAGVENLSGQYKADVTVKLYFSKAKKRDGTEFAPTMMLFANFKRAEGTLGAPGKIIGWGQAFKISLLLEKVGLYTGTISEDGTIPTEALETLIGKECWILQYPARHRETGEKVTNTYQLVAGSEMWDKDTRQLIPGEIWLRKTFQREMEAGYVKDFYRQSPIPAAVLDDPGF